MVSTNRQPPPRAYRFNMRRFLFICLSFWIYPLIWAVPALEDEFQKLASKPGEPAYEELLARVDVSDPLWVKMILNFWDQSGAGPENLWACDIRLTNQLLDDDPHDVLRTPIFHALRYSPSWEALPKPKGSYVRNYVRSGDFYQAARQLEFLETKNPFNLHILFTLALVYEKEGEFEAAIERLKLARERASDLQSRLLALKWYARIQVHRGNLEEAEQAVLNLRSIYRQRLEELGSGESLKDKRFSLLKNLSEVDNLVGILRFQLGKKVLSFQGFLELQKRFPGNFSYFFNKNKVLMETRKYESTLKNTNRVLKNLDRLLEGIQKRMVAEVQKGVLKKAEILSQTRSEFEHIYALLLRRKGEILFREKHLRKALEFFDRSVRKNLKDEVSFFRMGEIMVELGDLNKALGKFRRAAEHAPKGSNTHQEALRWIDKIFAQQAVDAIAAEDPERKKRDEFFQNLGVDEKDRILDLGEIIAIGQNWLARGDHKKLIRYFRGLQSEHPNVLEVWYLLARAYRELGQTVLAQFYYRRALELNPRHIPSLAAKVYYLAIDQNFEEALRVLEFMDSFASGQHLVLGAWGWYYYQNSQIQKAVDSFQSAIDQEPLYAEHHYRLGMAYFHSRLFRFALHKFQDAQTAGYPWSRASLLRGVSRLYLGELKEGEKALREAAKYGKDNPDITNFARDILKGIRETGRFESSKLPDLGRYLERSFPQFRTRSYTREFLQNSIGKIRSGRTFEVAQELRARLQEDPHNLELLHVLGYLHLLLDREDLAEEYFRSALDLNPLDYRAMNSLSEIEFRRGKIDECVIYWDRMRKVSSLIEYSEILKELSIDFQKRFEFNPSDEWAVYHYALLKLHIHKEQEALDILEQVTPSYQGRKTPYSQALLILHGQIYYKLGILQEKEGWIKMGRGILSRGEYRYLTQVDRYAKGVRVLTPPAKTKYKVQPAPRAQLDFLKLDRTIRAAKTEPLQSVPLRKRADYLRKWKLVDRALDKKDPKKVFSSYDLYLQKRQSPSQKYLETQDQFARRLLFESEEEKKEREALAKQRFEKGIDHLRKAELDKARELLISALSEKIDMPEAFYSLTLINFLEGEYLDLLSLMRALPKDSEFEPSWRLMKAHVQFHQGEFDEVERFVSNQTFPLILPSTKTFDILEKIYREVNDRAPGDLESSLKLALLYQSVGRFAEAERVLRQAGSQPGLIPYLCDILVLRGMVERRMSPVREAVKKMTELAQSQPKPVYNSLAKQLDRFLLTYRFLTE